MSGFQPVLASPRHASVFARVTDAKSGLPLNRARARLTTWPKAFAAVLLLDAGRGTALADADGKLLFYGLPDGSYTLVVDAPGSAARYGLITSTITVSAAAGATIANPALPPTAIAGLVQTGTGKNVAPVVMAQIALRGSSDVTFTDATGNYQLTAVEPGTRTVEISARGLKTQTVSANVKQGQTSTVSAVLSP